jgi:phage shock protein A
MIDTDKYEGHTPAPWDGILSGYFTIEQLKGIDKTLMQDAPLLLEEVKRLREVNDELQGDLEQFIERVAEDEAGLKDELEATEAEVKRLRKQLDSLREFCHKEDYDIYDWEVKKIEVIE